MRAQIQTEERDWSIITGRHGRTTFCFKCRARTSSEAYQKFVDYWGKGTARLIPYEECEFVREEEPPTFPFDGVYQEWEVLF